MDVFEIPWAMTTEESVLLTALANGSSGYTNISSNITRSDQDQELPLDMRFNDGHLLSIIVYSILMVFSAIGNLSVLLIILKIRIKARLSRVNLLLLHLAIADLFVTFLLMPLEIGWNVTVSWKAGDGLCRIMSFFRTFGIYLSGFVIICISLDRYFAVLKPLTLPEANKRGRVMLYIAWTGSVICSLPQSFIFHLEKHPVFEWYEQCITNNFFPSKVSELAYNFFGFTFMYAFPMIMILYCYISILYEIYKVNAMRRNGEGLRRSSMEALGRAKVRTLKMTLVIVATFFLCWSPYNIMSLWYWFDKESAEKVDYRIQKGLFLFACTNSCFNPLIYGLFHIRSRHHRDTHNNKMPSQRLVRPPYGVRVRWRPHGDCICGASSSVEQTSKHSSNCLAQNRNGCANGGPGRGNSYQADFNRRSRTTTMIPLTSREVHRHVGSLHSEGPLRYPNLSFSIHQPNENINRAMPPSILRPRISIPFQSDEHPL